MSAKIAFYTACKVFIEQRILAARTAMLSAQESSNSETKSSAGDKYETGRELANQERDRNATQLQEAKQLLAVLQKISMEQACDTVRPGAVVRTNLGLFYISIGAGKLSTAGGQEFLAVSLAAPVAAILSGKRAGDEVLFNGKLVRVEEVN